MLIRKFLVSIFFALLSKKIKVFLREFTPVSQKKREKKKESPFPFGERI